MDENEVEIKLNDGHVSKQRIENPDGTVQFVQKTYDDFGNLTKVEESLLDSKGNLLKITETSWDKFGNFTSFTYK